MMITLQAYAIRGKRKLKELSADPRAQIGIRASAYTMAGFALSAASLGNAALPLGMGLVCACTGWPAVFSAMGAALGYLVFWGTAGWQGVIWVAAALGISLLLGDRRISGDTPLLLPALAALTVSAAGVLFQTWMGDTTSVGSYLLRVTLAAAAAWLFRQLHQGRNPIVEWLCCGLAILALAQIAPIPGLSLGFVAAGALAAVAPFPALALAGLGLDLSGICPVPMTAVLCGSYLIRFFPRYPKFLAVIAPGYAYLLVAMITGNLHFTPLPALLVGCAIGWFLPAPTRLANRRGETGLAQVRLEMAASVLAQTEQLLLEAPPVPIDEDALVTRAAEQACGSCPCRKNCKDISRLKQLPAAVLYKQLLTPEELPIICRKSGRFLAQLHRAQEQLRTIRADRARQQEYRSAVVQQYRFLSEYLQNLSDGLSRRIPEQTANFKVCTGIYANRPAPDNGDRCISFGGPQCRHYVLLCDGMGTGIGAVREGKAAAEMLRRLLIAGYPVQYALESLNSLCALRSRAGIVTVELLEISLDSGRGTLYKWGAAPSYLVSGFGAEKIGTVGPPPGLSLTETRQKAYPLSLRRGELLLLVSDGIGQDEALNCCLNRGNASPGELAQRLLTCGQLGGEDDATVITVYLKQERAEQP